MSERQRFDALADALFARIAPGEVLLLGYYAELSDFVRLNGARVRQAGCIGQRELDIELIDGQRHASASLQLQGVTDADLARAATELDALRALLPQLPEDPYLNYAREPHDTTRETAGDVGGRSAWLDAIASHADGLDLVGILASGPQYHGFANSLGQRNWHAVTSFNFDFSVHAPGNRAVKGRYAGTDWQAADLASRLVTARTRLDALQREPVTPPTGRHRAYLAPAALGEIAGMLAWGGFSLKAQRTGQSPLQRFVDGKLALHPSVHLDEERAGGSAPGFSGAGYVLPERTALVRGGVYGDALVGPRSAREYGVPVNARWETPEALAMAAGELPDAEILARLGNGLYLSDLWYCNYSDRNSCHITGMTRYACFVVENGELAAPLAPMRFDVSAYDLLGSGLEAITREREWLVDASSYGRRSTASQRLPGVLVDGFPLTL